MMMNVLYVCALVDSFMLWHLLKLRTWLVEWFSWTTRGIERGVLICNMVAWVGWVLHFSKGLPLYLTCIFATVTLVPLSKWPRTKDGNDRRRLILLDPVEIAGRGFLPFFNLISGGLLGAAAGHHFGEYSWMIASLMGNVLEWLLILPTGGKPARRRKLAKDRLKQMFGAFWMPEPNRGGA